MKTTTALSLRLIYNRIMSGKDFWNKCFFKHQHLLESFQHYSTKVSIKVKMLSPYLKYGIIDEIV